jgi:hypothetical protein
MRSEREKLGREESIAFESRHIRWAATYAPETDTEEFLVQANVFVASEMERAKSAYLECAQSHVDKAEHAEIERVHDTGNRLFFDPRGVPAPLYGTRPFDPKKLGTSWSSEPAPALDPAKLVRDLESSAMGCFWIAGVLEELMERARAHFWAAGDRLRMTRLLGRHPVHAIDDRRVAEIFAASYALRPVGEHAFVDLQSDMNHGVLERYVKDVRAMWPDLSRKGDLEKARQSLIDLVQTEIDRIWAIAAEHEQKAGDEPARERARRAFVISPEAEAMRRSFLRSKGSLERGIAAYRKEKRARKADSDAQDPGQVPGKNISPYDYDGRPASWWNEQVGGVARRHREGGDVRSGGGQVQETGRERDQIGEPDGRSCGNDGQLAAGNSGAVAAIGREKEADGTRRVPGTTGTGDRGWESVVVEESDVLACQGFLPERFTGIAGESAIEPADALTVEGANCEAEASRLDEAGQYGTSLNAGCAAPVTREAREEAVDPGPTEEFAEVSGASQTSDKAPNEANFCDDVCIAQHNDAIDVPTNSGKSSGLDNLQTKPIFLETKPVPAGGPERSTIGESAEPVTPCLNERERRAAWIEMMRQEWIRSRAAKETRPQKHASALDAGTTSAGVRPRDAAGEAVVSQDGRGP